jgi:HEPN domain-containing protein
MKPTTEEWIHLAKDDLDVAENIKDIEHLTNMIAFHAHQAVEKCLKAVMEEYEINAQKIHNLETLYARVMTVINLNINIDWLRELNEVYISARYPGDLGLIPFGKPGKEEATKFLIFAKELYANILIFLKGK